MTDMNRFNQYLTLANQLANVATIYYILVNLRVWLITIIMSGFFAAVKTGLILIIKECTFLEPKKHPESKI